MINQWLWKFLTKGQLLLPEQYPMTHTFQSTPADIVDWQIFVSLKFRKNMAT